MLGWCGDWYVVVVDIGIGLLLCGCCFMNVVVCIVCSGCWVIVGGIGCSVLGSLLFLVMMYCRWFG